MRLTLTENIQNQAKVALKKDQFPIKYKDEAQEIAKLESIKDESVSIDLLEQISKCLDGVYLHELIKGSAVYIPPKPVKPKNPEFEAYMNKLRLEQQQRDYTRMVSSVVNSEDQKFHLGIKPDEVKEVKSHIATIFNIGFSMVAVYVAVYKASQSIVHDIGLQVLMALGGAIFIGTVEGLLYAKYAMTAASDKPKSKKKKTKKLTSI